MQLFPLDRVLLDIFRYTLTPVNLSHTLLKEKFLTQKARLSHYEEHRSGAFFFHTLYIQQTCRKKKKKVAGKQG